MNTDLHEVQERILSGERRLGPLFAFGSKFGILAIAHESQVFVYASRNESPLWIFTGEQCVIAVGVSRHWLLVLEQGGRMSVLDAASGALIRKEQLPSDLLGLAVTLDGGWAACRSTSLSIDNAGRQKELAMDGASFVAWSEEADLLAVGIATGEVRVMDTSQWKELGRTRLGSFVSGVTWHASGFWIAAAGERIYKVGRNGDQCESLTRAGGMLPDSLSVSKDGTRLAMRLSRQTAVVLSYPSLATLTTIEYCERRIVGVLMKTAALVGVGLDHGDGNKIDILTGHVWRTDPHPGQERRRWWLRVAPVAEGTCAISAAEPTIGPAGVPRPHAKANKVPFFVVLAILVVFFCLVMVEGR